MLSSKQCSGRRSLLAGMVLTVFITGCSANKSIAHLKYHKIYQSPPAYTVEFFSDVNFDSLYAASKLQTIVTKNLVCALGESKNFGVADSMRFEFRGRIRQKINGGQTQMPYIAYGDFYENVRGGTELRTLDYEELKKIIAPKSQIDCRVVMTVYGAKPYYSAIMSIPAKDILLAAQKVSMSDNSGLAKQFIT